MVAYHFEHFTLTITIFVVAVKLGNGLIDNGILGDPVVECGDKFIEIRFDTRNAFKGMIFVENHITDPECRSPAVDDLDEAQRNASLKLGFKGCGIERRRSNDPRGIFIYTSLVMAFHPEFLTKIDRVYYVQCFYMEMEKVLEKEIQIKMNPPPLQTEQVKMPICRYEVLDGSPSGPPIFYAVIGQMVYHKWTCDADTENQFCMKVHSCYADDGNGDRVQLIDKEGCARDKHLLQNLEYVSDLMVGKEAHVYKYADRAGIYFDCQITLTIKEPGQEFCEVPMCLEPPRRKRDHIFKHSEKTAEDLNSMIPENGTDSVDSRYENYQIENTGWVKENFDFYPREICMTSVGLAALTILNLLFISSSIIIFYGTIRQVRDKN